MSPFPKLSHLHIFTFLLLCPLLNASDVQTYFADEGTPEGVLVQEIKNCQKSLHACLYSFTDRELGHALVLASRRGVDVRVILDESQTEERNSEANYLIQNLGPDRVQLRRGRTGPGSIMHNKFAIFDGERVATGSYHWTTSAKNYNYENLLLLTGPSGHEAAEAFEKEFSRIWSAN